MEKINNNNELEIMRSQMASFKKQLEQQEIINSRIMAESTSMATAQKTRISTPSDTKVWVR